MNHPTGLLQKKTAGALCSIASAVFFGTMPLMSKVAFQHGSNAFTVAFGRYFFGCMLLFLLCLVLRQPIRIAGRQLLQVLALSLFFSSTAVLLYTSYGFISSGLATTLHFSYPIAVILLSAVFFHKKIGFRDIVCTLLCAGGMLLFYTPEGASNGVGILVAVSSGVTYAVYIVFLGRSSIGRLPVLTLTFWLTFFSAIEIALVAGCAGQLCLGQAAQAWAAEFLLALVATVLGSTLFQKGVLLSGAVQASLLSTFEPLTSVALGLLIFHETVTAKLILGILCILLSTVLLVLSDKE